MRLLALMSVIFAACASAPMPALKAGLYDDSTINEVVYVHEMDTKCEVTPRQCMDECKDGFLPSCVPQNENMVILYSKLTKWAMDLE